MAVYITAKPCESSVFFSNAFEFCVSPKMPSYELLLLVKRLQKPELVSCLKRAANMVFDNEGILRKIEYLGLRQLSYKMPNRIPNAKRFTHANFVLYHIDLAPGAMKKVYEDCRYDTDIVRVNFLKKESNLPVGYECTLDDELKPPVYRPSVQKLIEEGRKLKPDFDMDDHYNRKMI